VTTDVQAANDIRPRSTAHLKRAARTVNDLPGELHNSRLEHWGGRREETTLVTGGRPPNRRIRRQRNCSKRRARPLLKTASRSEGESLGTKGARANKGQNAPENNPIFVQRRATELRCDAWGKGPQPAAAPAMGEKKGERSNRDMTNLGLRTHWL